MTQAAERIKTLAAHVPITNQVISDACLMLENDLRILGADIPESRTGGTWAERFNELNDARARAIEDVARAALADLDDEGAA